MAGWKDGRSGLQVSRASNYINPIFYLLCANNSIFWQEFDSYT